MAKAENTGTVVQACVHPNFARELKELADRNGRSVSNLIRIALGPSLDTGRRPRRGSYASTCSRVAGGGT